VFDTALPDRALRHLVRYYYQVDARMAKAVVQPVPARSPQALEFTFGTPYEVRRLEEGVREVAHPVALIGAQTFRRVDLVMRDVIDAFTIVFQPGGLTIVFGIPAPVLTDDHFDAEAALGRHVRTLHQQLGDARGFASRVTVANLFLGSMVDSGHRQNAALEAARFALERDGCVTVGELADGCGLSRRQFERRFEDATGITPKLYCRIVRFEAALRAKTAAPHLRWTDVAHAMGYHDQMHMVHDFGRLSGATPTAIGPHLDMFVQPEVRARRPVAP
jgi:AraC-like DNA-binding protein